MHSLIIGGAGFIGTNLTNYLLNEGNKVTLIDNLSRGSVDNIKPFLKSNNFYFINKDVSNFQDCKSAFLEASNEVFIDEVWHLAANSDIPAGVSNPNIDLKDTFLTTFNILICMKELNIKIINFASSSAIYGDFKDVSINEDMGPLMPISNYGAMKLASEAQISAASESFLQRANIFRFPNVVGVPATHGVILDFIEKLKKNKDKLEVLGDGSQSKAYLHVSDLIDAMFLIRKITTNSKIMLVNIGPLDMGVEVKWIAEQVVSKINPIAKIVYGIGNKGWVGDVPKFNYSINKLQSFGWAPKLNSKDAILLSINQIINEN
jgi:UDP-glucose 4-epimerase